MIDTDPAPLIMSPLIDATVYAADGTLIGECVGTIGIVSDTGLAAGEFDVHVSHYQPSEIARLRTRGREFGIKVRTVAGIGRACRFDCALDAETRDALLAPLPMWGDR